MKSVRTHPFSFPRRVTVFFAIVVVSVVLTGCPLINTMSGKSGPLAITIEQERLTLGWDSSSAALGRSESAVESFNFYYRDRGTRDWSLISTIDAIENPTFTVNADSLLGYRTWGEFEFGVSSTTRRGEESRIHSSIDFDARPRGGWYVIWTRP